MGGLSEVTCLYDTRDKTAVEGKDYERTGGILTFDNGQKQKVISIKLLKHVFESAKTFEVILTQPTVGAKIGSINRTEVTITNNALYRPQGPQTSVQEKKVLDGGWKQCHIEGYNIAIWDNSIRKIQEQCAGSKIMLACRPVGSSNLTVLAWADRITVFGVTDRPYCGDSCSGQVGQGTNWYRTLMGLENGAWGFADGASSIYLASADDLNLNGDKRLSWHVNRFGRFGNGGWRCGTTQNLSFSKQWEKVI